MTPLHGRILEKLGVTRVVFPEREMAVRIAHSLVVPNVLDYIELSSEHSIVEVPAPPEFVGKTLRDIGLRVAVRADDDRDQAHVTHGRRPSTNIAPGPDDVVAGG